jgi:hypothetical protein
MSEEFVDEYTREERARFVIIAIVVGGAIVVAAQWWFFPWLGEFSSRAQCVELSGMSGVAWLVYGLFVGFPLASAIVLGGLAVWRGYKILRDGRVPPTGEKSFRATRITYGRPAMMWGWLHMTPLAFFLVVSMWGAVKAHELVERFEYDGGDAELVCH